MTHETRNARRSDALAPQDGDLHVLHAPLSRRDWVRLASGGSAALAALAAMGIAGCSDASAQSIDVALYASEDCGCCHKWADHMTTAGFKVEKHLMQDVSSKKDALQVPEALRSCHTAEVGGYVFEGHVPAGQIKRFIAERSDFRGLAAPGMPGGSPGMEDSPKVAYEVLAFRADGTTRVYAKL
jgi:hypothetical protein